SYRQAVALDPRNGNAYRNLGAALLVQRKMGEAVTAFQKSLELDPKDVSVYYDLGRALLGQKRWSEGAAALEKAVKVSPKLPGAHAELARAYFWQGQFARARDAQQRAVGLLAAGDPDRDEFVERLRICQRVSDLDQRLPLVLEGQTRAGGGE